MKRSLTALLVLFFTLSVSAQRLITVGPATTEIVVALGAQHSIVGTDNSSTLPPDVKAVRLGYLRQLPAEGMLALQPDQVIGSAEMAPNTTLTSVRQAGVKVTILSDGGDAAGLLEHIQSIALLLNRQAAGEQLQQQVEKQLGALEQGRQKQTFADKPKIIFLLMNEGRAPMIAGGGSVADALIKLAGGINPAQKLRNYQTISAESLLTLQPDLILISERQGAVTAATLLTRYPLLAGTPAGKHQAIMRINGKSLLGGMGLSTLREAQRVQEHLLQSVDSQ